MQHSYSLQTSSKDALSEFESMTETLEYALEGASAELRAAVLRFDFGAAAAVIKKHMRDLPEPRASDLGLSLSANIAFATVLQSASSAVFERIQPLVDLARAIAAESGDGDEQLDAVLAICSGRFADAFRLGLKLAGRKKKASGIAEPPKAFGERVFSNVKPENLALSLMAKDSCVEDDSAAGERRWADLLDAAAEAVEGGLSAEASELEGRLLVLFAMLSSQISSPKSPKARALNRAVLRILCAMEHRPAALQLKAVALLRVALHGRDAVRALWRIAHSAAAALAHSDLPPEEAREQEALCAAAALLVLEALLIRGPVAAEDAADAGDPAFETDWRLLAEFAAGVWKAVDNGHAALRALALRTSAALLELPEKPLGGAPELAVSASAFIFGVLKHRFGASKNAKVLEPVLGDLIARIKAQDAADPIARMALAFDAGLPKSECRRILEGLLPASAYLFSSTFLTEAVEIGFDECAPDLLKASDPTVGGDAAVLAAESITVPTFSLGELDCGWTGDSSDEEATDAAKAQRLRFMLALAVRALSAIAEEEDNYNFRRVSLRRTISCIAAHFEDCRDEACELAARVFIMNEVLGAGDFENNFNDAWETWGFLSGWERSEAIRSDDDSALETLQEAAARIEREGMEALAPIGADALEELWKTPKALGEYVAPGDAVGYLELLKGHLAATAGEIVEIPSPFDLPEALLPAPFALEEPGLKFIDLLALAHHFAVLLRPKEAPESLVLLSLQPAMFLCKNFIVGSQGGRTGLSLEIELPAALLDTDAGRAEILDAMARLHLTACSKPVPALCLDRFKDGVLTGKDEFAGWKTFPSAGALVLKGAAPRSEAELEAAAGSPLGIVKDAHYLSVGGRPILRRTELFLLHADEEAYLSRILLEPDAPKRLGVPAASLRLRDADRPTVVPAFDFADDETLRVPAALPKKLAPLNAWADAALLEGKAPLTELLRIQKREACESGFVFLSSSAEGRTMKRLALGRLCALVPQAAGIVVKAPRQDGRYMVDAKGRVKPVKSALLEEDSLGLDFSTSITVPDLI